MNNKSNSKKFKEYAWKMLLSFGFIYLFFYNGRQNINLVMTQMADDFGSTTTAIGIVSSSLFWCYASGQLINGRLGAYFGYKKFIVIGIIMFNGYECSNIFSKFNSCYSYTLGIEWIFSINGMVKWNRSFE